MNEVTVKIYPEIGDVYRVIISVPDDIYPFSEEEYVEKWIEENLNHVVEFEIEE